MTSDVQGARVRSITFTPRGRRNYAVAKWLEDEISFDGFLRLPSEVIDLGITLIGDPELEARLKKSIVEVLGDGEISQFTPLERSAARFVSDIRGLGHASWRRLLEIWLSCGRDPVMTRLTWEGR